MIPRRLLGVALLLAAYVPAHRLLTPERAGPAGVATRAAAEAAWQGGLLGTAVVLGLAVATVLLVPADRCRAVGVEILEALQRPAPGAYAVACGSVALLLATAAAVLVHGGLPTSVDEMAQLLHARAVAAGSLTVPTLGSPAATVAQNGIVTPAGWASIYPPLHTLALALGLELGAPWLVGPLATAVATALAALSFDRLLAPGVGRLAGALLAVTPFWLLLGATHLSHTTAAAALCLVLWSAVRARSGSLGWAILTGAAVGAAVTARPWIGLACSTALIATLWLGRGGIGREARALAPRAVALLVGGAPFAALLFWWNARLFGSPLRLGYSVAFGPAHGLGLHPDPWGNEYGVAEAVGYTAADLVELGARLLETPLPAVALVGLALVVGGRVAGRSVFAVWAAAALAANALYWHHGVHFGPRMLYEATPAWVALLATALPAIGAVRPGRGVGAWAVVWTLLGAVVLTPGAARTIADARVPPPAVPSDAGTEIVVFAHGSWASRIAARLAADGMRRDSIETALRRNDVCAVDRYARWRSSPDRSGDAPRVDWRALPGSPPTLVARLLSEGNPVRVAPNGPRDAACDREAASDRFGVIELEPLAWRAPVLPGARVVVVRDLGPIGNAALDVGSRQRLVYVADDAGQGSRLLEYEDGMELLWRGAARPPVR